MFYIQVQHHKLIVAEFVLGNSIHNPFSSYFTINYTRKLELTGIRDFVVRLGQAKYFNK